jgi:hypothetical protein
MEMMMTVGELRKLLEGLPDDMPCASYDSGGYLCWEFFGADVVDPKANPSYYPQPKVPYLEIGAA